MGDPFDLRLHIVGTILPKATKPFNNDLTIKTPENVCCGCASAFCAAFTAVPSRYLDGVHQDTLLVRFAQETFFRRRQLHRTHVGMIVTRRFQLFGIGDDVRGDQFARFGAEVAKGSLVNPDISGSFVNLRDQWTEIFPALLLRKLNRIDGPGYRIGIKTRITPFR